MVFLFSFKLFKIKLRDFYKRIILSLSVLLTIIILFSVNNKVYAGANEGINHYEQAYHLEKDYPLFAIPIYEKLLAGTISKDVRRIASIRLYFLYVKFKKYPELLQFYSKYGYLIQLKKEHQTNLHEMFKTYSITSGDFYSVYPLLVDPNDENISLLLEILVERNSSKLLEFSYSILNYSENHEALRTLLYYLPETLAKPSLKLAVLVKTLDPNTSERISEYLESENITTIERSDAIYLYAQYLKATKYYPESIENFNLSGSIANKERSLRESAKSYLALGKITTACSLGKFSYHYSSESDTTLKVVCSGKTIPNNEKNLKIAWEILASRDQYEFYENAVKWLYSK